MAFTSIDDLVSKLSSGNVFRADWNKVTGTASAYTGGRWYDLSVVNGIPTANTYAGTALAATPAVDATWGLYHGGDVTPSTKHIVNVSAFTSSNTGFPSVLMLVDIAMYYPGLNLTTATTQTLNNTQTLPRYTDGKGLRAFLTVTTASGANTPLFQMSYTNQDGTSGRAVPVTTALTASSIAGHITHSGTAGNNYGPFIPMAAGDTGIQSVESVTLTSPFATSGTGALVLCKPLLSIPLAAANVASERDMVNQLPSLPRVYSGASLAWLFFTGAGTVVSSNFMGHVEFGWS